MLGRTLWKGPRICSPAYDLKLRLTKCVIIRRGAPGSLVIAGGGGGGMLPRISSKLRLSTASAASPWDGSVAQKKVQLLFLCASRFRWGTVVHGGGVEEQKKPNKQTKHRQQVTTAVTQRLPRKLTGVIFLCSENKSQTRKKKRDQRRFWTKPHYSTNALHEKRWYVRVDAPH